MTFLSKEKEAPYLCEISTSFSRYCDLACRPARDQGPPEFVDEMLQEERMIQFGNRTKILSRAHLVNSFRFASVRLYVLQQFNRGLNEPQCVVSHNRIPASYLMDQCFSRVQASVLQFTILLYREFSKITVKQLKDNSFLHESTDIEP